MLRGAQAGGHCVSIVGYNDNPKSYRICKTAWDRAGVSRDSSASLMASCAIDTLRRMVDAILNTGWQTNRRLSGLWTINEDRNAWAHFDGLGCEIYPLIMSTSSSSC